MSTPGTLYLLPSTLGDMTDDALPGVFPEQVMRIAADSGYLIVENAKSTRALLNRVAKHVPLSRPMREIRMGELNVNTPAEQLDALIEPLLAGQDAGLVSEAGVPAVADPGANLVRLAHRHGIRVRPLVGPSSLLMALMASGLNGQRFAFNGYLPTDAQERARQIQHFEQRSHDENQTQIFIETPYRNRALLEALISHCNHKTMLCCATDVTLDTEVIQSHRIAQWQAMQQQNLLPTFDKRPTVFLFLADQRTNSK